MVLKSKLCCYILIHDLDMPSKHRDQLVGLVKLRGGLIARTAIACHVDRRYGPRWVPCTRIIGHYMVTGYK